MNNFIKFISLVFILVSCASEPEAPVIVEKKPEEVTEPLVKYSADPNYAPVADREYRRMTRQKMEDESSLQAGAGSLWVMEGQTSYLFAQNKQRRNGDPTKIKIEGSALKQLETKVSTIQELLAELENQKKQAELEQKKIELDKKNSEFEKLRLSEIEKEKERISSEGDSGRDLSEDEIQRLAEENVKKRMPAMESPDLKTKPVVAAVEKKKDTKPDLKEVELIPSRIIEKTAEGLYRISGQQTMTIMKRPYKVIATGLVRPEDFDDMGVSSTKILDPQYDIIHIKKVEKF